MPSPELLTATGEAANELIIRPRDQFDFWDNSYTDCPLLIHDRDPEFPFSDFDYRQHFLDNYFNKPGVLQAESYADVFPPDRERAYAAVNYAIGFEDPHMTEPEAAAVSNHHSASIREYHRLRVADDPIFGAWIERMLYMIPPQAHYDTGMMYVHFFRTRTAVVSGFHHDQVSRAVMYAVDTDQCQGGITTVKLQSRAEQPTANVRLQSGDMLSVNDEHTLHTVSDIRPLPDRASSQRDMMIITFKSEHHYPYRRDLLGKMPGGTALRGIYGIA